MSFTLDQGESLRFSAADLARRIDGEEAKLRFAGNCTGQENGTVQVLEDGKNASYENDGTDVDELLICTVIDENTDETVQTQLTIGVEDEGGDDD